MKLEKAREYFSDYHEGTLDNGLIQAFEHCLSESHSVREEYDSFVATMDALGAFKIETIEAPVALSDIIATRLEKASAKPRATTFLLRTWLTGLGLAGLAAVALVSAWLNLGRRGGSSEMAGFAGSNSDSPNVNVALEKGVVQVHYNSVGNHRLIVGLASGTVLKQIDATNQKLDVPLENPNSKPAVFKIDISGERRPVFVAVPGSAKSPSRTGSGTVLEFASAVAGAYRVPVSVEVGNTSQRVEWNLSLDARASISATVKPLGLTCDQGKDDLLRISDR